MTHCPACAGSDVAVGPASRATGRRIARCRTCRARFLENPESMTVETVPSGEMSAEDYERWVGIKREEVGVDAWREATDWIRSALEGVPEPTMYDVGAGDGGYLQLARDDYGFRVTGNEIVEGAITLAREAHGVDLELGDLADLGHRDEFDAVTLWCVLAHVPDGDQLLTDVHAMLRPGGVIYLQTPHWTAADEAALWVKTASRGRLSTLPDRRMAQHHRILHTRSSITAQLERLGFEDVGVEPKLRYTLTSRAYLASMNPPAWTLRPASWLLDKAVASRLAPRIVIDVRARKPTH